MPVDESTVQAIQIYHMLNLAARTQDAVVDRLAMREWGLTTSQLRVLVSLDPGEALPALQLARRMLLDPGTVTGLVRRVREKGLVTVEPSPDDRRVQLVSLTPKGQHARREVWPRLGKVAPWQHLLAMSPHDRQRVHQFLFGYIVAMRGRADVEQLLAQSQRIAESFEGS